MSSISSNLTASSDLPGAEAAQSRIYMESAVACSDEDTHELEAFAEGIARLDGCADPPPSASCCDTVDDGCDDSLAPLSAEEVVERKAWGFDEIKPSLGVARDSAVVGRKGAEVGFMIAERSTSFGFGIAKGVIGGIAAGSDGLRVPLFGRVMRGVGGIVRGAELITECSQAVAKGITLGSIDIAVLSLDAAGAEKYTLAKKTLGDAEFNACVAIGRAGTKFVNHVQDLDQNVDSRVVLGLALCAMTPCARAASVVSEEVDASAFARWAWLAMLVYPSREGCEGSFKVDVPRPEFLAAAAAKRGCAVLLDRATDPPDEVYIPAHAVLVDDAANAVVVSVRGTSSLRDVLCDLVCEAVCLEAGELVVGGVDAVHVHEGTWRAAQQLLQHLDDVVAKALEERPGYKLMVTGHSLGAGVACLLALAWRPKYHSRVTCVAFAPPPILDARAACAAAAEGVTSLVLGDDIIPRLSMSATVRLTSLALRLADGESCSVSELHASESSNGGDQVVLSPQQSATQERFTQSVVDAPVALLPPGRLLHLSRNISTGRAQVVQQDSFSSIVVSRSMLSSHLMVAYLRALGEM